MPYPCVTPKSFPTRSRKRSFPNRGRLRRRWGSQFFEDGFEILKVGAYPEGPPPELTVRLQAPNPAPKRWLSSGR
jgi:hypothetical protein